MHISRLTVRNFRNFHKATFRFNKGVNTLIGENGAGKSNALYAIRLLIDDALARRAVQLVESDFCRTLPGWRGHWIIISLDFDELDLAEGCQVIRHGIGEVNSPGSGRLTLFFRPTLDVRRRLFDTYKTDGAEKAKAAISSLMIDNYEAYLSGRAEADFLDDSVYRSIAGDVDSGVFPDPSDDDAKLIGVRTHGLYRDVSCTFVKALRDVIADLRGTRSNPLLALLRGTESTIAVRDAERITAAVRALNADISSLSEITAISTGVRDTMLSAIGHTYAPDLSIASELPNDIEHLLQHLALRVGDDEGFQGEIDDVGLGAANLVFIALKLLEYELKQTSQRAAHFLLIEEPEAHIHPHVQRTLFAKAHTRRTQVIVSSHSTHLSSVAEIRSMSILARRRNHAVVFAPSAGLTEPECARTERYLDAVRSTLLFAKGVVLVEGDAEAILIPALVRAALGVTLDEMGVSLISVGSAIFRQLGPLFHPDRIQRPCAIVTDLDATLAPLPADESKDTPDECRRRIAQKLGADRQAELNQLTTGNPWLRAFFAPVTFEVEFVRAGNSKDVVGALPKLYAQQAAIDRSATRLRDNDITVAGSEILRLAEMQGKGWFALLLADSIGPHTAIPEYVVEALAFASSPSLSHATLLTVAKHRLNATVVDAARLRNGSGAMPPDSGLVAAYTREFPNDILSALEKARST